MYYKSKKRSSQNIDSLQTITTIGKGLLLIGRYVGLFWVSLSFSGLSAHFGIMMNPGPGGDGGGGLELFSLLAKV